MHTILHMPAMPTHACFALLAFTEDAANDILCVCCAFIYFTTLNATANNCATLHLTCSKTRATRDVLIPFFSFLNTDSDTQTCGSANSKYSANTSG